MRIFVDLHVGRLGAEGEMSSPMADYAGDVVVVDSPPTPLTSVKEVETTFALLNGVVRELPLSRSDALEAGYTLLDAAATEAPDPPANPDRRTVVPTLGDRVAVQDWLRSISRGDRKTAVPTEAVSEETVPTEAVLSSSITVLAAPPGRDPLFGTIDRSVAAVSPLPGSVLPVLPVLPVLHVVHVVPVVVPVVPVRDQTSETKEPENPFQIPAEFLVPAVHPAPSPTPHLPTAASPSAGAVGSEFVAPTETVLAPTTPGFVPLRGSGVIIVSARSVSKFRNGDSGQKKLLSDVSIEVRTGDFTVITGPSGAGKSTLLNCLAGLDGFDAGDVFIEGHLLNGLTESDRARHRAAALGFVFQGLHLLPTLTVIENTELPLLLAGWSEEDARREAGSALTLVGIADQAIQYPETLSGGELQRAGIARAVVGEPRLVLADEPTGNLDRHTGREIIELFRDLHADGLTLLIATHDERLMELATSIVELENGRLTERRGPRAWR